MITQTIYLNMMPGNVCPVIHVSQYDTDEDALVFNLHMGSVPFTAGSTAIIEGTKPDKTGFTYAASYSDNVVTADLTEQMTAVSGAVMCELRITDGTNTVGTQNFILMVEPAALADDVVISDTDIPLLQQAIDAAGEALASASDAAASAAQAASTLTTAVKYSDIYNGLDYSGTAQTKPLDALQGALLQTQGKKLGGVASIANGTDLNTMTSIGEYQFSSNTASTLVHCPITIGGRLTVEAGIGINSSQYIRQTIMRYNRAEEIFTRVSADTGANWTNWYQFTLTDTGA